MTVTLTDRPPAAPTNVAPARRDASFPDAQPGSGRHRLARRLAERFALLAFGLYHLPLFLNNYPSLGGGGSDHGLAISWGHVFTPPGVWVARHLFHVAGPMLTAYNGDNGDIGEEFGRLVLATVLAALGAMVWTTVDRRRPRGRWVSEALQVLLRFSIALGLTSYAIAKIWREQFPPLFPATLDQRLGDLSPMALLWSFMEYSRPYSLFGGVMEVAVVFFLCFRRTATLGALLCIAVMANVAMLNIAYDVPVKLYSTMIVLSAAVVVLYDLPRLWAVFVANRAVAPAPRSPLHDRLRTPIRWTIKAVIVGSVTISSIITARAASAVRPDTSSALDGGWVLTAFHRDGEAIDQSVNATRWRRFFPSSYGVAIRLENDSLVYCGRDASPDANMIAFTCRGGRKGLLRWTRSGEMLQLDGTFDGAPLFASAKLLKPTDYRLLRSKPRLIVDR
ncbi:MAG: hypothetical protein ACJ796_02635 [Gemmatimonadaceae bacterium]